MLTIAATDRKKDKMKIHYTALLSRYIEWYKKWYFLDPAKQPTLHTQIYVNIVKCITHTYLFHVCRQTHSKHCIQIRSLELLSWSRMSMEKPKW